MIDQMVFFHFILTTTNFDYFILFYFILSNFDYNVIHYFIKKIH